MLYVSADFLLTLGSKNASLPLIARLWDLCFLHGPRALFSGLLAHLDLFFPVDCEGGEADSEELIRTYRAAGLNGDPEVFARRVLHFLHEHQGGVSAELVAELRCSFGQASVCLETVPPHVLAQGRELMEFF